MAQAKNKENRKERADKNSTALSDNTQRPMTNRKLALESTTASY
jgi:hypothetical protein